MTARSLFVLFGVLCTTSLAAMSLPNTVRRGASRSDQTAPPLAVDVTAADIR